MKQQQTLAIFGLTAALVIAALPSASAQVGSNSIIPGRSIGQTHLGSNGAFYLKKLSKPDAVDAGMSQTRQVWISKKGQRTDTLFIHTVSNGALNVQPIRGVTIDSIRVTSPWFRTSSDLSAGSTLAQIRRRFPNVRPEGNQNLYNDANLGIAFEFARSATAESPCIAIMVHPPGEVHLVDTEQVNRILSQAEHPS